MIGTRTTLTVLTAALLGLALYGCGAQQMDACNSTPDPGVFDTTDVINQFATGAGGSQSLGAGSNVNGPEESAVGISPCYLNRMNSWPPLARGVVPRGSG